MCGIMGFLQLNGGRFDGRFKRNITNVLIQSQTRGKEATGYAYFLPNEKNPEILDRIIYQKNNQKAEDFVKEKHWEELELPKILIGHTRLSTQGKPENNLNNHPIVGHKSVLVHNGKLYNDPFLFREHNLERTGEVDSEALLRLLEKFIDEGMEVEEAIKKTCSIVSGEYACAYLHSERPGELFLFRHGRPLELGYIKDLNVIVFASERKFIEDSFTKYDWYLGFFYQKVATNEIIYRELPNDSAITLRMDGDNDTYSFKPYAYTTTTTYGGYQGNGQGVGFRGNGATNTTQQTNNVGNNNASHGNGNTQTPVADALAVVNRNKGSEDANATDKFLEPGKNKAEEWFRKTHVRVFTCPCCKLMDEFKVLHENKYYCKHCKKSLLQYKTNDLNAETMTRSDWEQLQLVIEEYSIDK